MLYDPKWDQQTKADPFTLESLIAWLETKPPEAPYDFNCNGECLLGQYFMAMGFKEICVGGLSFIHASGGGLLSKEFRAIAQGPVAMFRWRADRWTFGAALDRARSFASES